MQPKIVTIGVYGFDSEHFFQALLDAQIDTFCDIRQRRAVRGKLYTFVNSVRLQQKLRELNIRYLHRKDLAPDTAIREQQKQADKAAGIRRRERKELGTAFIKAYEEERLAHFNAEQFLTEIGKEAHVIALFCVERDPIACHRSLLAQRLALETGVHVEHIIP